MSAQKPAKNPVKKSFRRTKKVSVIAGIVVLVALIIFAEIIRPDQDARSYTNRLQSATQPLNDCFEKLSDTTSLDIYYAPDIALKEKQSDVKSVADQVAACRTQLASFDKQAHDLLNLHFAGYTQTYHQAKVNQRQAYDVIGQSQDVLNQYADLADFLNTYYSHIEAYLSYFNNLQTIEKSYGNPTKATVAVLAGQASDLHKRATQIRAMPDNISFNDIKQPTADMFDAMGTGFDNVVKGYTNYSDYYRNIGDKQVDAAVANYDSTIIDLPFSRLQSSYVPKQVQQLPVKVKNLLAAQSE